MGVGGGGGAAILEGVYGLAWLGRGIEKRLMLEKRLKLIGNRHDRF